MPHLTLSPDEEAVVKTYLDFDDALLGQIVKAGATTYFLGDQGELKEKVLIGHGAALCLIALALEARASGASFCIYDLTYEGVPLGAWEVRVRKLNSHQIFWRWLRDKHARFCNWIDERVDGITTYRSVTYKAPEKQDDTSKREDG